MRRLLKIFPAASFRIGTLLCYTTLAGASTIVLSGVITQCTADTSIPAAHNPSLNGIADGDAYMVTLGFSNSITTPGDYPLDSVLFTDVSATASESGFLSASLTIGQFGATDQISVLGCLADCALGNQLALEFTLPAADLNTSGATAPIPALLPMDLLEDGGNTDIHGTVAFYSYHAAVANAPEPATLMLAGASLITIGAARLRRQ